MTPRTRSEFTSRIGARFVPTARVRWRMGVEGVQTKTLPLTTSESVITTVPCKTKAVLHDVGPRNFQPTSILRPLAFGRLISVGFEEETIACSLLTRARLMPWRRASLESETWAP